MYVGRPRVLLLATGPPSYLELRIAAAMAGVLAARNFSSSPLGTGVRGTFACSIVFWFAHRPHFSLLHPFAVNACHAQGWNFAWMCGIAFAIRYSAVVTKFGCIAASPRRTTMWVMVFGLMLPSLATQGGSSYAAAPPPEAPAVVPAAAVPLSLIHI